MHLRDFLHLNRITYAEFAKLIKTSRFTIHEIVHGRRLPKMELAIEIEKATAGKVTLYDWVLAEDKDKNKIDKNKKTQTKKIKKKP